MYLDKDSDINNLQVSFFVFLTLLIHTMSCKNCGHTLLVQHNHGYLLKFKYTEIFS